MALPDRGRSKIALKLTRSARTLYGSIRKNYHGSKATRLRGSHTRAFSTLYWIEYYAVHEILLLLNDPALTLTEVTDRMHFPAPPMLTRYLKRTIGKTPSEYRSGQV